MPEIEHIYPQQQGQQPQQPMPTQQSSISNIPNQYPQSTFPQNQGQPMMPGNGMGQMPEEPKRKKTILFVVVFLLLLALIAGGVYWITSMSNQEGNTRNVPTEVPQDNTNTQEPVDSAENGDLNVPVTDAFAGDQDRDGIPDEQEQAEGLSTRDFDTDGDGLSDKAEKEIWNTDPKNNDTDGDGYPDGFEVMSGYNPAGDGELQEPSQQEEQPLTN